MVCFFNHDTSVSEVALCYVSKFYLFIYFSFIIHMCIQGLVHFSPLDVSKFSNVGKGRLPTYLNCRMSSLIYMGMNSTLIYSFHCPVYLIIKPNKARVVKFSEFLWLSQGS
jgi:hypothetical protein